MYLLRASHILHPVSHLRHRASLSGRLFCAHMKSFAKQTPYNYYLLPRLLLQTFVVSLRSHQLCSLKKITKQVLIKEFVLPVIAKGLDGEAR